MSGGVFFFPFRDRSTNGLFDTSIRHIIDALQPEGVVRLRHQQDGLRYIYSATMSPAVAKRTALQQYLHTFFGGSLRQMMTALVREGSWADEDLDALKAEIERARKGRKQ